MTGCSWRRKKERNEHKQLVGSGWERVASGLWEWLSLICVIKLSFHILPMLLQAGEEQSNKHTLCGFTPSRVLFDALILWGWGFYPGGSPASNCLLQPLKPLKVNQNHGLVGILLSLHPSASSAALFRPLPRTCSWSFASFVALTCTG